MRTTAELPGKHGSDLAGHTAAALPKTMRAAVISRFGDPFVLHIEQRLVMLPDGGEVLIELESAGVGVWDTELRKGWSPSGQAPHFPIVLGTDGAGTVAAVGSHVRRFRVGDPVYAYSWDNPKGGFYSEYVTVPAERVGKAPASMDLRTAGAIPTTGLTALQGIDETLRVRRGESVIVLGASGGVGSLAVQFVKRLGARVLAIASGDDGAALAKRLGADESIDGRRADFLSIIRRWAPRGIQAVFATAAGPALERCIDAIGKGGRLAYPNGVEPEPKRRPGIKFMSYDVESNAQEFERLTRGVEETKLQVPIAGIYPLEDAAKAHERLESGHTLGKIILTL